MEKILEKIWCEKLSFQSRSVLKNSRYKELLKEQSDYSEQVADMLPPDGNSAWEKMIDCQSSLVDIAEMEAFSTGVRFGAELILEILIGKSENFQEKTE